MDSDDWISDEYLSEMSMLVGLYKTDIIVRGWTKASDNKTNTCEVKGFNKGLYRREEIENKIFPALKENGGRATVFLV